MGLFSRRQKREEIRPEQKWDYISLNDFKSTSCFTPFAYAYLHFSLLLSITVYAVDTFTAVNLLAFNKWSSEITPPVSFTVAKWIFSICIILSFVNLAYEHFRAQRTMSRGSVAECYLDNLAVRLESIRWGKGQGWKRFLVFAELTKSKKGAEYIALFTYFSFQSWIRVLLCSGPRQVLNALTLYSVYNAKLSASGTNVENTLLDFFSKIRALAVQNYQQALILSGMLFTLIIWLFSFLSLLLAFLFFLFFLWSYIPRSDGGLSGFCSRKINKRLMKIVATKLDKAMQEEERKRKKAELKAAKKNGELPPTELKATIPNVGPISNGPGGFGSSNGSSDKLQGMPTLPSLHRNDTMATLPVYTSRPGTPGSSFELGALDQKTRPPPPARSGTMNTMNTMASGASSKMSSNAYSTRAPLLGYAAEPGMANARSASPAPSIPTLPELGGSNSNGFAPPRRTGTGMSTQSFGRQGGGSQMGGSQMGGSQMGGSQRGGSQMGGSQMGGPQMSGQVGGQMGGPQMSGHQMAPSGSNGPPPLYRANTGNSFMGGGPGMPPQQQSYRNDIINRGYSASPAPHFQEGPNMNGMSMNDMPLPPQPTRSPAPYAPSNHGPSGSMASNRFMPYRGDETGRASPAPSAYGAGGGSNGGYHNREDSYGSIRSNNYEGGSGDGGYNSNYMDSNSSYRGMPPTRSATAPMQSQQKQQQQHQQLQQQQLPQRNLTAPLDSMSNHRHERQASNESSYSSYFEPPQRPGTAASQRGPVGPSLGSAGPTGPTNPARPPPGLQNSAGPMRPPARSQTGYSYSGNGWGSDVESQRGSGRY